MRVTTAECFRYTLPLTPPLRVGSETIEERQGLLLCVKDDAGHVGWGDAAPLPGFSSESIEKAESALTRLVSALPGTEVPETMPPDGLTDLVTSGPASVTFAAESALLELVADARPASVATLLGADALSVPLNALISDDCGSVERFAEEVRTAGFQAVKLKVGRRSVAEDVARVRAAHRVLSGDVHLRLDANRAWTFEQAVSFAEAVDGVPLQYVEEPLQRPDELSAFVEETRCPVALDETTREVGPKIAEMGPITAVVLKPTLLGGISATRRWVSRARTHGARPVLSSAYESGIGIRMHVALAAAWSEAAAGLSTYMRLGSDVMRPRLRLGDATADTEAVYASSVDRTRMTPISSSE